MIITRPHHPFQGQSLEVFRHVRMPGGLQFVLILALALIGRVKIILTQQIVLIKRGNGDGICITLQNGRRHGLQFRLDAYNSLNHPNFNLPGRIFGGANFGVISSAADPRELQWAVKLLF